MEWLIRDDKFLKTMAEDVDPWLDSLRQTRTIYRTHGQPIHLECYCIDSKKGNILISHGFTESADKYHEVIYYFLKEGYNVFVLDHCGHGHSYRLSKDPDRVHVDQYTRYVDDFLYVARRIKRDYPGPLNLYCHSMGSAIGLLAASKNPGLFNSVIVSAPMIKPLTGGVPMSVVSSIAGRMCYKGKNDEYMVGHKPYETEVFENTPITSRPRFEYYQQKREHDKALQTSGASWNWLRETGKIYQQLCKVQEKGLSCPVLLFQAGDDTFVDNEASSEFIHELSKHSPADLVVIPNARHEIYNSKSKDIQGYWNKIFSFLNKFQSSKTPRKTVFHRV